MSRTEYDYTTGDLTNVAPTATFAYTYDTGWKDQLVSFNGQSIAYDQAGNPTSYRGASLSWTRGRLLASYKASGAVASTILAYDANGIRKHKVVPGTNHSTTTEFLYSGNNLLQEKVTVGVAGQASTTYRAYIYNSRGIIGFVQGGNTYSYRKNLFGDIIAIYRGTTKFAEYLYDAYGNCKVYSPITDTYPTEDYFIGNINPFRYRGYYWDNDLQLYYIQGRYYDPQTGRFIQPANVSGLNPQTINGLNLYSYANNNPIGVAYSRSNCETIRSIAPSSHANIGETNDPIGENFIGDLIVGATALYDDIDKFSSYFSGSLDALLTYINNSKYQGLHNQLNTYSNWLMVIGIGLEIASSAYNNYMNPNLTASQKWASFGADVGYIAVTSGLSYLAGNLLTKGAVALGTLVGGPLGGIVVVVGVVAGTFLIAVISNALDNWWEEKKEEWFN